MSAVLVSQRNDQTRYFAIPHLVLQAFDDPISTWRTNAANDPSNLLFPTNLVRQRRNKNVVLLLTEKGGHLGWPMGFFPHSWKFMNNFVAAGFVSSYVEAVEGADEQKESLEDIRRRINCDGIESIPEILMNDTPCSQDDVLLPLEASNQSYVAMHQVCGP